MRGNNVVWNTKIGDKVKVYNNYTVTEMSTKKGEYYYGVVIDIGKKEIKKQKYVDGVSKTFKQTIDFATVKPCKEIVRPDRYLERENVEVIGEPKIYTRKIFIENKK